MSFARLFALWINIVIEKNKKKKKKRKQIKIQGFEFDINNNGISYN